MRTIWSNPENTIFESGDAAMCKISDLMQFLVSVKAQYGDLDVYVDPDEKAYLSYPDIKIHVFANQQKAVLINTKEI